MIQDFIKQHKPNVAASTLKAYEYSIRSILGHVSSEKELRDRLSEDNIHKLVYM